MASPITASLVLVRRQDGKVLAVSRGLGSDQVGLPGGKVDPRETFAAAAVRELHEETGLQLESPREIYRAASRGGVITAVFVGRVTGVPKSSHEGEVQWVDPSVLVDPARTPFPEHARGLFQALVVGLVPTPTYRDETMTEPAAAATLDLGPGDVHVPSAMHAPAGPVKSTLDAMKDVELSLDAAQRKKLPPSQFADPSDRKFPIHNKAHADNAAARLEQQKASLSAGKYKSIKRRIKSAQRKFGEQPKTASAQTASPSLRGKGLRMAISHPDGTRTEIRHMSAFLQAPKEGESETLFAFTSVEPTDAADDAKPVWIQLAKDGVYRGHAKGAFALNSSVYASLIRNFKANKDGQIAIDFGHASEMPPTSGDAPMIGTPAQGWITDLRAEPGRLMALVKWGDLARSYIRGGQYKFISPAIRFKQKNQVSGEDQGPTLTSAALTNLPFLQGMEPLAASTAMGNDDAAPAEQPAAEVTTLSSTMCYSANEYMPRIKSALGMTELSSVQECSDQLGRLRDHLDAAGGDASAQHHGVNLASYLMPLRTLAQPQMGATWDQVLDIIDDLLDAASGETEDDEPAEAAAATAAEPANPPVLAATAAAEPTAPEAPEPTTDQQETTTMTTPATPATPAATVPAVTPAADAPVVALTAQQATDVTTLRLSLQSAEHNVRLLTSENEDLRAWKADREEADLATEASIAFETYKDKKGLTEGDRPLMLSLLRGDATAFRQMYPAIAPSERHLLRTIAAAPRGAQPAGGGRGPAPRVPADLPPPVGGPVTMSLRDLSRQIASKERCSIGAAQIKASRILRGQRAQQVAR